MINSAHRIREIVLTYAPLGLPYGLCQDLENLAKDLDWRDIKDGLPEEGQKILACNLDGSEIITTHIIKGIGLDTNKYWAIPWDEIGNIEHFPYWRPLA